MTKFSRDFDLTAEESFLFGRLNQLRVDDFNRNVDVNLLIVLRDVTFADLRLIGATLEREANDALIFATPLVIAPSFLTDARDSFPIELADIAARHRVLQGDDLLASIRINPAHIREEGDRFRWGDSDDSPRERTLNPNYGKFDPRPKWERDSGPVKPEDSLFSLFGSVTHAPAHAVVCGSGSVERSSESVFTDPPPDTMHELQDVVWEASRRSAVGEGEALEDRYPIDAPLDGLERGGLG